MKIETSRFHVPSSTLLSSWVTLTAKRSILACRELARSLNPCASLASSPNRSSACLDRLDSCLIVLAKVPLVAASSSDGSGKSSGMVPRATCTGSTSRFGSGILPAVCSSCLLLLPITHSPLSRDLKLSPELLSEMSIIGSDSRNFKFFHYITL